MGYNRISGKSTEGLERYIEDTTFGGYMTEGAKVATITNVKLDDEFAELTFKSTEDESIIRQRFFFHNYNKTDTSYLFKQLVSSVSLDTTELWQLIDEPNTCDIIAGRRVKLLIGNNGGVKYTRVPGGYKAGDKTASSLTELAELLRNDNIQLYRTVIKELHSDNISAESNNKTTSGGDSNDTNNGRRRKIPSRLEF